MKPVSLNIHPNHALCVLPTWLRVHVCAGLTVRAEQVVKNIYHGPKQESSQGVLNGPACLEKPFSKWMPLSIRVSDRNLPRAMPAGNKIASLCAPFLFMRSLFSQTKKNVKCVQIIFEFVLHGKRQGSKLNIMWSVQFLSVEILFFLTSEVPGERERGAKRGQHKNSRICFESVNLRNNTEIYNLLTCFSLYVLRQSFAQT